MRKLKSLLSAAAFGALAFTSYSFAEPYGMAGCGLGSMVIKGSNSFEQIFVGTTNQWTGTQTFGITSGTSNCRDNAHTTANLYYEINKEAMKRDVARGNGETIVGLAQILGCKESDGLAASMQKNYAELFAGSSAHFMDTAAPLLHADGSLQCSAI